MLFSSVAFIVITIWLVTIAITMAIKRSPAALAAGMLTGLLFLPQFNLSNPGVPVTKELILSLSAGAASFLVARHHGPVNRVSLLDLPVVGLCTVGMASSLSNGLGAYDGVVNVLRSSINLGIPWFVGKAIFSNQTNALVLVRLTILAGLVYIPFCVFEMKMAPVLHEMIYGYTPRGENDFVHAIRYGMWRPTVFMTTGLQLSVFMGITSVLALWGHVSGNIKRIANISTLIISFALGLTTLLCVSTGAIVLTMTGWIIVMATQMSAGRLLIIVLACVPVMYPIYRMLNIGAVVIEDIQDGSELAARRESLKVRITNEDTFLTKWRQRPVLGWTAWNFRDVGAFNIVDSLWISMLGCYGLLGWGCWSCFQFLALFVPVRKSGSQRVGQNASVIMGVCVLISWFDNLMNSFPTTMYVIMAGAAASFTDDALGNPRPITFSPSAPGVRLRRAMWPTAHKQTV